jgi:type IV pilus biogenesis protein PilP
MSRKKKLLLIYGALVLMLLGTAGWYVWQTLDAPASRPMPKPVLKEKTPFPESKPDDKLTARPSPKTSPADATGNVPAQSAVTHEAAGKGPSPSTQALAARPDPGKDVAPSPVIAETGNVDGLSNLHVQIEEYRLLVQIEELKAKLTDLKKAQIATAAPAPPVLSLPALTPPQSPEPATAAQSPPRRRGPVVLSVHGVDENLVAAVRLDGGKRITLRKGEKFGGGVVVEVSRSSGVVVRNGKKTSVLPFE